MKIDNWRKRIDEVDHKILELLNERTRYAIEIGQIKRKTKSPIYIPERENEIIERLTHFNHGPLSDKIVRSLFQQIIEASRRLVEESTFFSSSKEN